MTDIQVSKADFEKLQSLLHPEPPTETPGEGVTDFVSLVERAYLADVGRGQVTRPTIGELALGGDVADGRPAYLQVPFEGPPAYRGARRTYDMDIRQVLVDNAIQEIAGDPTITTIHQVPLGGTYGERVQVNFDRIAMPRVQARNEAAAREATEAFDRVDLPYAQDQQAAQERATPAQESVDRLFNILHQYNVSPAAFMEI